MLWPGVYKLLAVGLGMFGDPPGGAGIYGQGDRHSLSAGTATPTRNSGRKMNERYTGVIRTIAAWVSFLRKRMR